MQKIKFDKQNNKVSYHLFAYFASTVHFNSELAGVSLDVLDSLLDVHICLLGQGADVANRGIVIHKIREIREFTIPNLLRKVVLIRVYIGVRMVDTSVQKRATSIATGPESHLPCSVYRVIDDSSTEPGMKIVSDEK